MKQRLKPEHLGFLSVLAGAGCIGLAPIWVRLSELGPVSTAFHRLLLALPLLWVWQSWDSKQDKKKQGSKQTLTCTQMVCPGWSHVCFGHGFLA